MKKIVIGTLVAVVLGLGFVSCSSDSKEEAKTQVKKEIDPKNVVSTTIGVDGMTCESCEENIQTTASKLDGVVSVKASHVEKTTVVEYDQTITDEQTIKNKILDMGYRIIDEKNVPSKKAPAMKCGGEMKCGAGKCGAAMTGDTK